jgi:hypothetical protein
MGGAPARLPLPAIWPAAGGPVVGRAPPPPPVVAARPRPAPPAAPPPEARSPAHERALVEAAQAALARDDAPGALAALARHAHDYPDGALAEEAAALRVQALARVDDAAAREAARRFLEQYPESIHRAAIASALRDDDEDEDEDEDEDGGRR